MTVGNKNRLAGISSIVSEMMVFDVLKKREKKKKKSKKELKKGCVGGEGGRG